MIMTADRRQEHCNGFWAHGRLCLRHLRELINVDFDHLLSSILSMKYDAATLGLTTRDHDPAYLRPPSTSFNNKEVSGVRHDVPVGGLSSHQRQAHRKSDGAALLPQLRRDANH